MNKDTKLLIAALANERGVEKSVIASLLLDAFSAYVRKNTGGGVFTCRHDESGWTVYRVWQVIADDVVMDKPDAQWRVMDARDEGFTGARAGDVLEVEVEKIELTRQLLAWLKQYLGKHLSRKAA